MDTKQIYAGKIVAKSLLTKQHQRDKVRYVYKFVSHFALKLISVPIIIHNWLPIRNMLYVVGHLRGLTGSVLDPHLSMGISEGCFIFDFFITFWDSSAHLVYHMHKSCHKISFIILMCVVDLNLNFASKMDECCLLAQFKPFSILEKKLMFSSNSASDDPRNQHSQKFAA